MVTTSPISVIFQSGATQLYYYADFEVLRKLAPPNCSIILTDNNLKKHYSKALDAWKTITVPAGEHAKTLTIVDDTLRQLIKMDAGRDTIIVGFGGGVVTDLAGFVASIYKRGLRFGFMPTSLLGMVDAAIGGKNGINIGDFKNMAGVIRQPEFLLYHHDVLSTLPHEEWVNGFAEIIKHSCIKDPKLFNLLQQHNIVDFQKNKALLQQLIERNVTIKTDIVQLDESEKKERKLLNFGHTFGHAIEKKYELPHGHAVAIGMVMACKISEKMLGFTETEKVLQLLERYQLPITHPYDPESIMALMLADKKRFRDGVDYILLKHIGHAEIQKISIDELHNFIREIQ